MLPREQKKPDLQGPESPSEKLTKTSLKQVTGISVTVVAPIIPDPVIEQDQPSRSTSGQRLRDPCALTAVHGSGQVAPEPSSKVSADDYNGIWV